MPKRKFDALDAEEGEMVTETEGESEDSNSSIHTNSSTDVPTEHKGDISWLIIQSSRFNHNPCNFRTASMTDNRNKITYEFV